MARQNGLVGGVGPVEEIGGGGEAHVVDGVAAVVVGSGGAFRTEAAAGGSGRVPR